VPIDTLNLIIRKYKIKLLNPKLYNKTINNQAIIFNETFNLKNVLNKSSIIKNGDATHQKDEMKNIIITTYKLPLSNITSIFLK